MHLPVRKFGLGLRSRVDLAPAAYVGALCRALPRMLDSIDSLGVLQPGFLPQLEPMLGAGSFDEHNQADRFGHLLNSEYTFGRDLAQLWARLQADVGNTAEGALGAPAAGAGAGIAKLQHALTKQREDVRFQTLDVAMRELEPGNVAKAAWLNVDKFSTSWVTRWPAPDAYLTDGEFSEVTARYLGLHSPACAPVVGERIGNTRLTVDPHGMRLTTASLPGDGWRQQHDAIKWRIHEDLREMQVPCQTEVYGLFRPCLPRQARQTLDAMPVRQRQGLVPDMMVSLQWGRRGPVRDVLCEVKTLHHGVSTYPPAAVARCGPVARRAEAVNGEYAAKARELDARHCGTARGFIGPVEAKLRSHGPIRGLVFGAWSEASPAAHALLDAAIAVGARRHWRSMTCTSPDQARGVLAWLLHRRWGVTAARENARLLLSRLACVGSGAAAAAARRNSAMDGEAANIRRAACHEWRGPRCRLGRRGF